MNDTRVRLTDRRLLIIFVLLIILLGGLGTYAKVQLDRLNANCQANRANTVAFNAFIGRLQAVTLGSSLLDQEQVDARVAFYQQAKQPVPRCPAPVGDNKLITDPPPPPPIKPAPQLP